MGREIDMILRRVMEHVRTQNWTAIAPDFVIVVVGVFIDKRNTAVEIGLEHGVTPFDVIPEKTLLQTLEASEKMRAALRSQAGLASAHN